MYLRSFLITVSLLVLVSVKAQKITRYNGKIFLDSLRTINADFKIDYSNSNEKELYFYLNKNAKITNLKINNSPSNYKSEDATDYMIDFKKIIVENIYKKDFRLQIQYSYPLDRIENETFLYNPHWIELSFYTGWFPINLDDRNYSYKLDFQTPRNYQIISSGNVINDKNKTVIINKENYKDIPVIISDKFQVFSASNDVIKFYGTLLSNEQIKDLQNTSDNIYNYFDRIFGKSDSKNIIVAVNPFAHPMSYARKGFISLSLKKGFADNDKKTLAHEIGHLWWKNASFGTYEEWLNESFAEFSALDWMQRKVSPTEFKEILKKYEKASQNPEKISQLTPNHDKWYSIVYYKYPYILYQLKQKIGNERMLSFLKATYENKISSTRSLLELLRKYTDENTVKEIEREIY